MVREKRHEEAIGLLERASELAPDRPHYAFVHAVALHSTGKTSRALETLKRAHERHPGYAELLFTLATVSRDSGDVEAAARYARQLIELAPGHPGAAGLLRELGAGPHSR
jgi:tetratricopeptide (TPR) repeat protein